MNLGVLGDAVPELMGEAGSEKPTTADDWVTTFIWLRLDFRVSSRLLKESLKDVCLRMVSATLSCRSPKK